MHVTFQILFLISCLAVVATCRKSLQSLTSLCSEIVSSAELYIMSWSSSSVYLYLRLAHPCLLCLFFICCSPSIQWTNPCLFHQWPFSSSLSISDSPAERTPPAQHAGACSLPCSNLSHIHTHGEVENYVRLGPGAWRSDHKEMYCYANHCSKAHYAGQASREEWVSCSETEHLVSFPSGRG